MQGKIVSALIAHLDSSFEGPNGDYPAILETIAELTARQAAWKPTAESNSIWQIVDHLAASKEWQIEMIEKGQAESPPWIEPGGDEESWAALLARLKDAHARLRASISRLRDEDLLGIPDPDLNRTLLELILSSGPAHECHHGGQIHYLRGLQNV